MINVITTMEPFIVRTLFLYYVQEKCKKCKCLIEKRMIRFVNVVNQKTGKVDKEE